MSSDHLPPSAQATLDAIGDAVITIDASGGVTYMNPAAEVMTEWTCPAAMGLPITSVLRLVDGATRLDVPNPLLLAMSNDVTVGMPLDCVLIGRQGRETAVEDSTAPIHDAGGEVSGAVMVFRHVGAALARSRVMSHAALHDTLTGLPNRLLVADRLASALSSAQRRRAAVAVGFLDVDDFKQVNDRSGHLAGDRLLQEIAARLQSAVRQSDTVGRYGGDEFVVVLPDIGGRDSLRAIATNLVNAATGLYPDVGRGIHVSISLGFAVSPRDGNDVATLLARADRAMYRAKAQGRGRYALFEADGDSTASEAPPPPHDVHKDTDSLGSDR
jgi:diguanylate cyclase (GGDEF)-like protein/PAS domain S-box-containing protein